MSSAVNQLDTNLVNAFSVATTDVLRTMAGTEVILQEIKPQKDHVPTGDISAVIGIMGGASGEGMVALSFPKDLASILVARLLGMSAEEISPEDRCDGIGEVVNMISGQSKTALSNASGTTFQLSLPSIILGSGHEIAGSSKNSISKVLVFETEGHHFHLQLSFKLNT